MLGLDYSSSDESSSESGVDEKVNSEVETKEHVDICNIDALTSETVVFCQDSSSPAEASPTPSLISVPESTSIRKAVLSVAYSAEDVNPNTIERCHQYLGLKNFDLTESIRSKKDFGNPHILDVVVEHFGITEVTYILYLVCSILTSVISTCFSSHCCGPRCYLFHYFWPQTGSNYPKALFDPSGYSDRDYEDGIRRFNAQVRAAAPPSSAPAMPRVVSSSALLPSAVCSLAAAAASAASESRQPRMITSAVTGRKRRSKFSDRAS